MRIKCPKCRMEVPPGNVSLTTGWAKCGVCNEIFALADVVGYQPSEAAPAAVRPFDAWTRLLRTPQQLGIVIPPEGMRAALWVTLAFDTVWLSFVGYWTYLALRDGGIGFALFSVFHWAFGFLLLAIVLLYSRGSLGVYLDANQMVTELRCLAWRWRRSVPREKLQGARHGVATVKEGKSTYQPDSLEIIYENGSFSLPCNSPAEETWLISEINEFLKSTAYSQPAGPVPVRVILTDHDVIAGYPTGQNERTPLERPADALTHLCRTPERLAIEQSAQGFRSASCGKYLCWAIIPLAMEPPSIAFLLNFGGKIDWVFILVMAVVWYVPLSVFVCFMLGAVVWLSSSERSICCDPRRMDMELRCWRWRRRRSMARDEVQCARSRIVSPKQKESLDNMDYTHAVQIVYEGGSFNLPCKHAAEQAWLLDEINGFLMS